MRDSSYKLNMNTIPFEVFCALNDMDKKYIGTKDYMGIAFFLGRSRHQTLHEGCDF